MEKILNFILRGMAGCLLFYLGNQVLGSIMEGIHVGYNLIRFSWDPRGAGTVWCAVLYAAVNGCYISRW